MNNSNNKEKLKEYARRLREDATDAERLLWFRIRRKQLCAVQFYRQRPIGRYIVDFYAYSAKLVVELDGSQHFEPEQEAYDKKRSAFLESRGLRVLRFNNLDVLKNIDGVLEIIYEALGGI